MIAREDAETVIDALILAADQHLQEALRQRHRDTAACGVALRAQMRLIRIVENLQAALAAPLPGPETPALLRRQP
jgi:hypothetical protein